MARLMAKLVSPACHQMSDSETINNTWNKKTYPTWQGPREGSLNTLNVKSLAVTNKFQNRNSYAKIAIKPFKRKKSYQEYL